LLQPDMVLIGQGSKEAGDVLEAIYARICDNTPVVKRMSVDSAEICKLAVNCFVTTKIAFANMIGDMADLTEGADKHDILGAVGADTRIGHKYLRPGFGYGGPCFPRDNRALGAYAK
jgi:UDPglucose 6-dehydrogenase